MAMPGWTGAPKIRAILEYRVQAVFVIPGVECVCRYSLKVTRPSGTGPV